MISPLHKTLVQRSFRQAANHYDLLAELLYKRLFEIAPSCKILFTGDMHRQGRKLVQMIAISVSGLNLPETLIPAIEALGQRHVGYGVRSEDYEYVGEALLYALEQVIGEGFTPEIRDAWTAFYEFVADTAQSTILTAPDHRTTSD